MLHFPNCAWTQANPDSDKNRECVRKLLESYKTDFLLLKAQRMAVTRTEFITIRKAA